MSHLVMFDSIDISQIPAAPQAVAGYVDGAWPTAQALAARFPHALLLTIAVDPAHDAECLDIETGDATPASAAAWYARQKARGVQRPVLYASVSVMQADVIPVLKAAGIDRGEVRLWTAHFAGTHICGPSTCSELGIPADGTQHNDRAFGRDLDQSLLLGGFFTVPAPQPPPVPAPIPAWQEALLNALPTLSEGAADQQGQVFFVHRLQALTGCYARITGLGQGADLKEDGVFGPATKAAVEAVQGHANITVDGVAGPRTWSVLLTGAA